MTPCNLNLCIKGVVFGSFLTLIEPPKDSNGLNFGSRNVGTHDVIGSKMRFLMSFTNW